MVINDYSICLWKRSSRSDDPERFSDDSRGKKDERFMCLAALFADSRINGGAKISICTLSRSNPPSWSFFFRGTLRQFLENICSEDDLRSRIFGTFVVKFLACLPLLGFSNI